MSKESRHHGRPGQAWLGRLDGVLNVNKPEGVTSMDVVRRIKRASHQKRVGHGGTLDPFASGVIPICLGQATRMMEYLINGTKAYRAVVELGVETDTYDVQGTVMSRADTSRITLRDLKTALAGFVGNIQQVPPMYSALKRQGKRLYELARAGIEVERKPRHVQVMSIEVLGWSPPWADLQVQCGRGFYVRSLAHDLGQVLNCGGHVNSLVRLRTGPFHISDALSVREAERRFDDGTWEEWLHPPDIVVNHLRAAIVGGRVEKMIRDGRAVPTSLGIPSSRPNELCRVYGVDGRFVAVVSFNPSASQWQPDRVFDLNYHKGETGGSVAATTRITQERGVQPELDMRVQA